MLLELLGKYDLNCNRLAKEIKCSQTALRLISLDKSRITTSIALRLAKFFGTKPEFWLIAQMEYNLSVAAGNKALDKMLKGISTVGKPAAGKKPVKAGKPAAAGKKSGKQKE
jgi:addiction module HigA family antidote